MNADVFGQRLRNARIMRGLSMDSLCIRMGNAVSKMAISKYENGQMFPDSTVLIKLSEALEMPVDYFFRPFSIGISSVRFRKKGRLPSKLEKSIRETVADRIDRYVNIEEICNETPVFELPSMPVVSIDDVFINAGKLREEWNLGNDGIVCFIDLLEVHGIKVVEIDASGAFDGFSAYVNEKFPVIVLDKNVSAEQKRLTAAHELGHLVLSFDASLSSKETEKLCSLFASEFLIPRETFISFVGRKRPSLSFGELEIIQRQYGISCDALMKKARDCGVLSEFAYSSYCNKKNSLPLYKAMFDESRYPGESSERFARLVYKALSSELITESKAAALIGSSLELIRKNSFIG